MTMTWEEMHERHTAWKHTIEAAVQRRVSYRGADLHHATLDNLQLAWGDFAGANFYGANLYGTDLRHANLVGADLRYATLSHTDLREADLRGADLRETWTGDTEFAGALLVGARFGPELEEA